MRAALLLVTLLSATPVRAADGPARPAVALVDGPESLAALLAQEPSRPLVVHVWAAWCAPCGKELARTVPMFEAARKRGARVVLLSLDDSREQEGTVPQALARAGFREKSWIVLNVEFDRIQALLDPKWNGHVPATFVLRGGTLRRAFRGPVPGTKKLLSALSR